MVELLRRKAKKPVTSLVSYFHNSIYGFGESVNTDKYLGFLREKVNSKKREKMKN